MEAEKTTKSNVLPTAAGDYSPGKFISVRLGENAPDSIEIGKTRREFFERKGRRTKNNSGKVPATR